MMEEETTIIIAALSTLTPPQLLDLTHSILSLSHLHHRRLSFILSSPSLFSLTLHNLLSLSLPQKTLLIARHLLSFLHLLTIHFQSSPPPLLYPSIKLRDLDAVLLLLFLCETHQHDPDSLQTTPSEWRVVLSDLYTDTMLTNLSGIGVYNGGVLIPYIEMVARYRKFISMMGCCGGKQGREVAASCAAVVALPTVEVRGSDDIMECAICKEEMREGRDVCELPCKHLFHWMCILLWLRKRNTCPCCRFPLPTDDVFEEIQRLWGLLVNASPKSLDEDCTLINAR